MPENMPPEGTPLSQDQIDNLIHDYDVERDGAAGFDKLMKAQGEADRAAEREAEPEHKPARPRTAEEYAKDAERVAAGRTIPDEIDPEEAAYWASAEAERRGEPLEEYDVRDGEHAEYLKDLQSGDRARLDSWRKPDATEMIQGESAVRKAYAEMDRVRQEVEGYYPDPEYRTLEDQAELDAEVERVLAERLGPAGFKQAQDYETEIVAEVREQTAAEIAKGTGEYEGAFHYLKALRENALAHLPDAWRQEQLRREAMQVASLARRQGMTYPQAIVEIARGAGFRSPADREALRRIQSDPTAAREMADDAAMMAAWGSGDPETAPERFNAARQHYRGILAPVAQGQRTTKPRNR